MDRIRTAIRASAAVDEILSALHGRLVLGPRA
jgi:hypothetical protein